MSQNDTPTPPPPEQLDPASLDDVVGGATHDVPDARKAENAQKARSEETAK